MFHGSRIEAIKTVNTVRCLILDLFFTFSALLGLKRQPWKAAMENCSLH